MAPPRFPLRLDSMLVLIFLVLGILITVLLSMWMNGTFFHFMQYLLPWCTTEKFTILFLYFLCAVLWVAKKKAVCKSDTNFLYLRKRSGWSHYVFGSSVRTSFPFCFCQYLKNCEVVLHQTWYEGISGGIILCLDFRVTGSKVTAYFEKKNKLVQYFTYYET